MIKNRKVILSLCFILIAFVFSVFWKHKREQDRLLAEKKAVYYAELAKNCITPEYCTQGDFEYMEMLKYFPKKITYPYYFFVYKDYCKFHEWKGLGVSKKECDAKLPFFLGIVRIDEGNTFTYRLIETKDYLGSIGQKNAQKSLEKRTQQITKNKAIDLFDEGDDHGGIYFDQGSNYFVPALQRRISIETSLKVDAVSALDLDEYMKKHHISLSDWKDIIQSIK